MLRTSRDADASRLYFPAGPDEEQLEVYNPDPNHPAERAKEQVALLAPTILIGRDGTPIRSSTFGMDRYVVSVRDAEWDGNVQSFDTLAAADDKIRKLEEENEALKAESACFQEALLKFNKTIATQRRVFNIPIPLPTAPCSSDQSRTTAQPGSASSQEYHTTSMESNDQIHVFQGAMIFSETPEKLEMHENATLVVSNGTITAFHATTPDSIAIPPDAQVHRLPAGDFLIPGFVDTHNHAPQWPVRGLGQGLHILDWLSEITFPFEARFADAAYAADQYRRTIADFLSQGITTASYYASRHEEATKILADECHRQGQRALVGKCNMDARSPDFLRDESAENSLRETEACVAHIRGLDGCAAAAGDGALVRPVLTPRFAISCTPELLRGLGDMAKREDLPVQTHFNEASQEVDATRDLFPEFKGSEADLYEHFGLLGSRSILAHCTVMNDYETKRIHELDCGVAHCPVANMTVGGGFMAAPIRDFLRRGIKIGLGTDSGGGWSNSMLVVMRLAMITSNAREVLTEGNDTALSLEEVFYMATMGGARVCGLEKRVGSLEVGKEFDAIWATAATARGVQSAMTPMEEGDGLRRLFEKFVMTGDDRNILRVYVRGRRVAGHE
ncbi:hypothetical protein PspLS_11523 [Pyricularia sp. CBS 133598]|nr:hypothetical protein PspLS_11523 [Pyricularia sp. CBS 133598]